MGHNRIYEGNSKYRFTKEEKEYRKLSVGEKATLVAMAVRNKQPYFSSQLITIKEKEQIELTLT